MSTLIPEEMQASYNFTQLTLLSCCLSFVLINSFLYKTAASDLRSQCNFPSTLAEWIQSARSYFSLGTTQRITKWLYLCPVGTKSDVKSITGKTQLQKQDLWDNLGPGTVRGGSSEHLLYVSVGVIQRACYQEEGGTSNHQLQLSRPKLRFSIQTQTLAPMPLSVTWQEGKLEQQELSFQEGA